MKKGSKLLRLILFEIIWIVISIIVIIFKTKTDNIFFPNRTILIILAILGAIYLGAGIWLEKL